MKNADKPIHPCMMQQVGESEYRAHKEGDPKEHRIPTAGLTKREYFAAMAMQGMISQAKSREASEMFTLVLYAVDYADMLFAALNNEPKY